MKRATLIYNPVAGRKPERRESQVREAGEILQRSGIDVKLRCTSGLGSATELARAAVSGGDEIIIACGGDGTINEVMNGICPGDTMLGILPGGTANIIAKELGLPHDPVRAARQLPRWLPRRICVGRVTGCPVPTAPWQEVRRYFLSVAGVGFDAYVIHKLTFDFKLSLGVAAYVLEGARQVMRYGFPPLICRTDSREIRATFGVVQRTSRYAGWFRTAPNQSISKPQFGLSLYKSERRLRYFLYAMSVLIQRPLRDVEQFETCKIQFTAERPEKPVYFELDGELAGTLPAIFELVPNALTLLMPQQDGVTEGPSCE